MILNIKEFIQELSYWFLIYVIQQGIDGVWANSEHIGDQVLLFAVDEEGDELSEVSREDWVERGVLSSN